ncbi:hypothetical protein AKJ52_00400 [candidate division MSBL1 archaeon SCGC-AAA382C18]|uniref:Uncharacterized protein n=1 Tax=candidate division MSBL1 archaeon SCGC-AAA382C18 TaxID=1698281 RepID=A0A133VLN8_9EURY|nr:hypothetical protein AKJ52_00400 [candidate division MSBL1 archaeon SCGC-AAA382C18]
MTVSAGLDVHKEKCHGVIVDEDGEVLKDEEFENSLQGMESFFQGFRHADAVIEASYSWRPAYERLEEVGIDTKLAHPNELEAISNSETKTDSIDAKTLAHLLRTGFVPEAYVPPRGIRELRDKTRLRARLGDERSRMKGKIRAELEKHRIEMEKNPFTESGKRKLREMRIEPVNHYLAVLETIEERIEKLEEEFKEIVEDYEEAQLLRTIPGVSHFSALLILAEIGDIDRFPDPEKLCSYSGLVPKVHQSGDHRRLGSVKKERNKFLQWILIECVWIHIGCSDSQLTQYYHRKKEEKDSKRAAIATANKMLKTIYYMLKRGEEFRPEG